MKDPKFELEWLRIQEEAGKAVLWTFGILGIIGASTVAILTIFF